LKYSELKMICCVDATLCEFVSKIDRETPPQPRNYTIRALDMLQYGQVPRLTRYVYFTFLEIYE